MTNSNLKPVVTEEETNLQESSSLFPEYDFKPNQLQSTENYYKQTESYLDWNQTTDLESSINKFYSDDNDGVEFKDETGDPVKNAYKLAGGLGLEIGTALAVDVKTSPLLLLGPKGWLGYGVINFGAQAAANYSSQKIRGNEKINWGELFSAASLGIIPGTSGARGAKGITQAAGYGAGFGVADQFIQKGINEKRTPTVKEGVGGAALGGAFGAAFKKSLDTISDLSSYFSKKYAGKTADEINQVITPDEVKKAETLTKEVQKVNQELKLKNVNSEITGSKQLPDSPKIGTEIPRGETAQSGAVFIERVDKGTGQTGPIAKAFNLPNTYDLAVLELQELNATQLAELGIKKADIAKLSPRKTINLLKKNFDNVRKDLLPGEYRMEGYSESRRKLYKKWFKDDPDVNWVDRQTGKASTIDDEMSIPYLTVKDQPPKLDLTTDTRGKGEFYHGTSKEIPDGKVTSVESGENITDGNLLGNGFYTTDDLTTAGKYQKKGKKQVLKPDIPLAPGATRRVDMPYGLDSDLSKSTNATSEEYSQLLNPGIEVPSPDRLRDLAKQARQFPIDNPYSGAGRTNVDHFNRLADRLDELAVNPPKAKEFKPVVYKLTEKQPVKFFDADNQISWTDTSPETKTIREALEDRDYGETLDFWERSKTASYADLISELKDEVARLDRPIYEATEIIDDLNSELQKLGYGGLTHQGGVRAGKGKRLHKVNIYWDAENQLNVNKVDVGGGGAVPPRKPPAGSSGADVPPSGKKKQDLGDPTKNPQTKNPQQYTNKGLKPRQLEMVENTIKILKDKNVFTGSKAQSETKLGALGMFDQRVIDLSNSKKIKEYVKLYSDLHDLVPEDELTYALAQTVVLASDGVVDKNIKFVNGLNSKNLDQIQEGIDEVSDALLKVEEWLAMGIPLRTKTARTMKTMQMKPESGIAGKTVDEVIGMTPAQKNQAAQDTDITLNLDEQLLQKEDFRLNLQKEFDKAKETGDFSELYKLANVIKQTEGKVETITALVKTQALGKIFDKSVRVFNEVGINALLSAPTTNEVNLFSGVLQSYLTSVKLALGSRNADELEAVARHFVALHSNFNFARKAWKKSWDMEDNFINMGNIKAETGIQRYVISSDGTSYPSKAIDVTGKTIRLPSRLMTATDALVQAPNLIASATFEAFMEGRKRNLTGDKLNQYVKGHTDAILEYYAENAKNALTDPTTKRILTRAQEFSKRITFTNDIRTEDIFGKGAAAVNKMANKHPLARTYFSFTRAPTNILKSNLRMVPGLANPVMIKGQNVNLLNEFVLPELRHDLLSLDPVVAQQARGEVNMATGLGLTIAGLAYKYKMKHEDDEYVPPKILTGGGPDWTTKEGKAMWKSMYKNGWRPYSEGKLQYEKNGSPLFKNGEPVYVYKTYENLAEPISGFIGLMVDFVNSSGFIDDKPYDDFTVNWIGAVGRNIFNKSYTTQINEAIELIASAPSLVDDEGDAVSNYKTKRFSEYVGKQFAARAIPYSNLGTRLKRTPADILEMMGYSSKEIEALKAKRDTRVRAGDLIDQDLEISDPRYNETMQIIERLRRDFTNNVQEKIPGYGGGLPFQVEHITNEKILYPQKEGLDLLSLQRHSKSKNHKIWQATKLIGRILPEPKDIITGSASKKDFEPVKLNTTQYNKLREVINTHIPRGKRYGDKNLLEAMNSYLEEEHYEINKGYIEELGLRDGKIAADAIYLELSRINNYYINSGENLYIESQGRKEIKERFEKKDKIKKDYYDYIEEQLAN